MEGGRCGCQALRDATEWGKVESAVEGVGRSQRIGDKFGGIDGCVCDRDEG